MAARKVNRDRGSGPRPDNARRVGDRVDHTHGSTRAAPGYVGPPRWAHATDAAAFATAFTELSAVVIAYGLVHGVLLFWVPPLTPPATLAAVCLLVSLSVRSHDPADPRYSGQRAILRFAAGSVIVLRLGGGLVNGWEHNGWFVVHKLPDAVRAWGDLDPVLRALLVDPIGFLLAGMLLYDLCIPQTVRGAISGGTLFTQYQTPDTPDSTPPAPTGWLMLLPFGFAAAATTADRVYALALGLGTSFIVGYLVTVEAVDIIAVRGRDLGRRFRHFARYSDRRYAAINAAPGLLRLLGLFAIGAFADWLAGPGPYARLVPLAAVVVGSFLFFPQHIGLAWGAIRLFAAYPARGLPRAGVHDLSAAVENHETRRRLLRFALLAWGPFAIGCVDGLLPTAPKFDGWGIVWTDLSLKRAAFATLVLLVVPAQLVAAVVRVGFGPTLAKAAEGGAR